MLTIYSDASLEGWGATDSTGMVDGRWDEDVAFEHINSLELFAAKLALEKLAGSIHDCHIQLKIDNTTAVTHINRMGGGALTQLVVISTLNLFGTGRKRGMFGFLLHTFLVRIMLWQIFTPVASRIIRNGPLIMQFFGASATSTPYPL